MSGSVRERELETMLKKVVLLYPVNSPQYVEAEMRSICLELEEIIQRISYYSDIINNAINRGQEIKNRLAETANQNRGGMYE